jgi:uncharacterized membrane protein
VGRRRELKAATAVAMAVEAGEVRRLVVWCVSVQLLLLLIPLSAAYWASLKRATLLIGLQSLRPSKDPLSDSEYNRAD